MSKERIKPTKAAPELPEEPKPDAVITETEKIVAAVPDDPRGIPRNLAGLLNKVNDQYGGKDAVTKAPIAVIKQASRAVGLSLTRVPTGIFSLDKALGGGIPKGRIISIMGEESSGKTTTILRTIASAQKYCRACTSLLSWATVYDPVDIKLNRVLHQEDLVDVLVDSSLTANARKKYAEFMTLESVNKILTSDDADAQQAVKNLWLKVGIEWKLSNRYSCKCLRGAVPQTVWLDIEGAFDPVWATAHGVDLDYVYVTQSETAEQAIDVADAMLRSGEVDYLVVDSVAQLAPIQELSNSVENWQVGLLARLVNKALRRWSASINIGGVDASIQPIVILINQIREKPGKWGPEQVRPGGRGQKFADSVLIVMHRPKLDKDDENGATKGTYSFHIKKNKTYRSGASGEYTLYLAGTDVGKSREWNDVLAAAIEYDVIQRVKSNMYTYKGYDGELHKWGTQKQIIETLQEDYMLGEEVRHVTLCKTLMINISPQMFGAIDATR